MKEFNGYPLSNEFDIIYNKNSLDSVAAAKVLDNFSKHSGRLPKLIPLDNYGYFNLELKNDSFIIGFNKFKYCSTNLNVYYMSPYLNGDKLSSGNNCIEMIENFLNINIYINYNNVYPMSNDTIKNSTRYKYLLNNIYNMDFFNKKVNDMMLDIVSCQDISDNIVVRDNVNYYISAINQNIEKRCSFPNLFIKVINNNGYVYKIGIGNNLNNFDYLKLKEDIDGMVSFNLSANKDTVVKVFSKSVSIANCIKDYLSSIECVDKYNTLDNSSHGYMLLDLNIKKILSILE